MRELTRRPLHAGPLDVVGDVHGEWEVLEALLGQLGYNEKGLHPEGRKLVFVGDLCDRGPDSPRVIHFVRDLVLQERAWCLLGNHELNVLRGSPKSGNGWFFETNHDQAKGEYTDSRQATAEERETFTAFFDALPLTLERADLRLVHACWQTPAQDRMQALKGGAADAYAAEELRVSTELAAHPDYAPGERERAAYDAIAADPKQSLPPLPHFARQEERYQNGNAVRVLTSGMERVTDTPFYSTGKWRLHQRVRWWNEYADEVPVIFGHYWRMADGASFPAHKGAGNQFEGVGQHEWLGPKKNAYCVDFSVGFRSFERAAGKTRDFAGRLGAVRWPERQVILC
jgi:hypothetical protein